MGLLKLSATPCSYEETVAQMFGVANSGDISLISLCVSYSDAGLVVELKTAICYTWAKASRP